MIVDNASYNKSYKTQNLAEKLGIELKYLPTYSPNLNLIERVWKFYKKKVLENIYYKDFESFLNSTYKFFKDIHIYSNDIKKLLN